ncbi:MAG: hypothetical protein WKF48_09170 [Solirubrobacteraceae bacterium]
MIGVLLLPIGLLTAFLLTRSIRVWPEILGLLEGVAAVFLAIAALNVGSRPCPSRGELVTDEGSVSCGGLDPWPWLIIGLLLAFGAAVAYRRVARSRSTPISV